MSKPGQTDNEQGEMMSIRTIKLLHVEDDEAQRRLMAHHLKKLKELQFAITYVESEDAALAAHDRGDVDFVLLDYQLVQGNGLSCLRKLRKRDPILPIIAISGTATSEIALELLEAGADDYIQKQDFNSDVLCQSMRGALRRADAWRPRVYCSSAAAQIKPLLNRICTSFCAAAGPAFTADLDEFETSACRARLSESQLQCLFEEFCKQTAMQDAEAKRLLRPILLELLVRLRHTGANQAGHSKSL